MRLAIVVLLLVGIVAAACAKDTPVKVYVNGKLQQYSPSALVRDSKTYVPLRQGATSLGFEVEWMSELNAAKLCDDQRCVLIRKTEGIVVNSRLFLPLRKAGESFGAKVRWDAKSKAVIITKR